MPKLIHIGVAVKSEPPKQCALGADYDRLLKWRHDVCRDVKGLVIHAHGQNVSEKRPSKIHGGIAVQHIQRLI